MEDGTLDSGRSVVRRRTRSERDLVNRASINTRRQLRQSTASSVERHRRGGRAASGSSGDRRRGSRDPSRAVSTRSVNADHLSTRRSTSSEHLRRVALAVRQLTDSGMWIGFCHTVSISLCIDLFVFICVYIACFCFIPHSCSIIVSTVGWTWWDWSLILRTCLPSVLWHCWLGHLTRKNPSPMWCVCAKPYLHQSTIAVYMCLADLTPFTCLSFNTQHVSCMIARSIRRRWRLTEPFCVYMHSHKADSWVERLWIKNRLA